MRHRDRAGAAAAPSGQLRHVLGDEVLMGHRHEGQGSPDHRHDLACPVSGRIHDNVRDDVFAVVRVTRQRPSDSCASAVPG